ncbi:MAG: hypothetical protein RIR11_4497 [Bacteroidota bacterium]|jgi:hypothetical protein
MQNILFEFISKYITLTEDEQQALIALDLFRSSILIISTYICRV